MAVLERVLACRLVLGAIGFVRDGNPQGEVMAVALRSPTRV
jgi:hypothetical protein